MDDQNKNLILATALSFIVILGWLFFFPPAEDTTVDTDTAAVTALEGSLTPAAGADGLAPGATDAPRIAIDTPRLSGTLSLQGARLDDLALTDYKVSLDEGAPDVQLLTPVGEAFSYYAVHGWNGTNVQGGLPGPDTLWEQVGEGELTQATPVTLQWENGAGLTFTRVISVDENYMFDIADTVANNGAQDITLQPYGFIARHGRPDTPGMWILHEGVVRMSDGKLQEIAYKNLDDLDTTDADGSLSEEITVTQNGWTGFTDKYWMTTLIPEPGTPFKSTVRFLPQANIFQTFAWMPETTIAAGGEASVSSSLFAGAKEWEVIRDYQNEAGVDRFVDSIDWGWFFFLTKPMFWLLHTLNQLIGNMGWAIIALTFCIKLIVLPLAYKSAVSMAKMKELQPEMEKLKERAGDDRNALQQGMMKLYKDNKVNPAAGCLPILIQVPIFFSLYKVIVVTIELYHAEWFGWIRDLSAPDPSSLFNLFGLLPWAAPENGSFLHLIFLGILPLILGVSMWLQQKLNPAPADASQRMIFAWMPWIFMFMMGSFASGLIIYWITNNVLTFAQQYIIMRSHGHKPDVFGNIFGFLKKKPAVASANSDKKPGGK